MHTSNPQLPKKLNFLVCCVGAGPPPSPERNVDGRGESSMTDLFFQVTPFEPTLHPRGGELSRSQEAEEVKFLG